MRVDGGEDGPGECSIGARSGLLRSGMKRGRDVGDLGLELDGGEAMLDRAGRREPAA